MTELVIRALTESDAYLFDTLDDPAAELVGHLPFGRRYAACAQGGRYRPEWTWVALRDGLVVPGPPGGPGRRMPGRSPWTGWTSRRARRTPPSGCCAPRLRTPSTCCNCRPAGGSSRRYGMPPAPVRTWRPRPVSYRWSNGSATPGRPSTGSRSPRDGWCSGPSPRTGSSWPFCGGPRPARWTPTPGRRSPRAASSRPPRRSWTSSVGARRRVTGGARRRVTGGAVAA